MKRKVAIAIIVLALSGLVCACGSEATKKVSFEDMTFSVPESYAVDQNDLYVTCEHQSSDSSSKDYGDEVYVYMWIDEKSLIDAAHGGSTSEVIEQYMNFTEEYVKENQEFIQTEYGYSERCYDYKSNLSGSIGGYTSVGEEHKTTRKYDTGEEMTSKTVSWYVTRAGQVYKIDMYGTEDALAKKGQKILDSITFNEE